MLKFSGVELREGRVFVKGPFQTTDQATVQRLDFMLAQPDVLVRGEGRISGAGWNGDAQAGDLEPGVAHGFGVATLLTPGTPPGFQSFTWGEQVEVR
jgi:hypothetical protein